MSTAFDALLANHVIRSLDRQLHLAEVIGDRPWRVELKAGTLTFGDDLVFAAQLLGTQSDETDTFIWGWDHPSQPAHTDLAEQVRAAGDRLNVPELVARKIDVTDTVHAHTLGIVGVGLTNADAYYRGAYDGGAAVLVIRDPAFPQPTNDYPLLHATTIINQAISAIAFDHRRAIEAYLTGIGMLVEATPTTLVAREPGRPDQLLTTTFDDLGRLVKTEGTVGPR